MVPKENVEEIKENIQPKLEEKKTFSFEILKIIKESQQQHGLRHGDYQRYRGYCSRRIRRLRKVLKLPQGDRRHFKRRDVTETHLETAKADERLLHIPLVMAERAWAYAMQLRQEANTEIRKRIHLIQRLRKACAHASQLEELCKSEKCDARTKLEAQAYVAWMHGTLQFELQLWQDAAENLKKAQLVYETLCASLPEDEQLPYKQRVDEIAPSLRYCAYNIGDDKAINLLELRGQGLMESIDALLAQAKQKKSEDTLQIDWQGLKVVVRNEKIRLFLESVKDLDASLKKAENSQARISLLEQMLIDCRDAIATCREEVRLGVSGSQLVLTYLLYIRLIRTIERNNVLIEQAKKPQDIIRLYEIILQQMTELKTIAHMEENVNYQKEINNETLLYKAYRCYHMAKFMTISRKWKEALVLYVKSTRYISEGLQENPKNSIKKSLNELKDDILKDQLIARAQYVLENTNENEIPIKVSTKSKKPLIERLDEYSEDTQILTSNPNVVNLPPEMQPIPCKPLFFDLAFNMLEFPDLESKIEPQNKGKAAGMSGFVKGLFGWGGKK